LCIGCHDGAATLPIRSRCNKEGLARAWREDRCSYSEIGSAPMQRCFRRAHAELWSQQAKEHEP